MRKRAPELERGVQGGWCRERKAARTDTGSMRADAKDGRAGGVPLINSLEFFINSFNSCRGKRGVFFVHSHGVPEGLAAESHGLSRALAPGFRSSGKPRVVKGFGDGIAGSCGEPCADGPGRLCGRAGALTGFQRGVDNNQQLAGTGDDSGHF